MQSARLEFQIPRAEVPEGADPRGLEKRIDADLKAFQDQLDGVKVEDAKKEPVPEGATGISELVTWGIHFYFERREEIDAAMPLLRTLLGGISTAIGYYMRRARKGKKSGDEPMVRLRVGEREITLPAENASIETFLKNVSDQLAAVPEHDK